MTDHVILSYAPLTRLYLEDLSSSVGWPVRNIVISSLPVGGTLSLIRWFLSLRAHTIYIPHPRADFTPLLPIMRILARLATCRAVFRVDPGFQLHKEGRLAAYTAAWSLAVRTAGSLAMLPGHFFRLRRLVRMPRRDTPASTARQILYLNTNSSYGVFDGWRLSDTAGIVSALTQGGHRVTYVSINQARELAGIADTTICTLPIPFGFVYPRDLNIYRYERTLDRWGKRQTRRDFAFLYHRLTQGSTAAIGVSRHLGIPLVVECKGSEVSTLPRLAALAEEAMLRHADLIVTVSDSLRDELVARGIDAKRILTCPDGVDPDGSNQGIPPYTWTEHAHRILAGLGRVMPPPPPKRKTTVLINAVHAKSGGGVTYLRNILPLWAQRDDLVVHIAIQRGQDAMMREIAPDSSLHILPARPRLATVLIQEQIDVPRLARRLGADVVFSPANYGPVWGAPTVILLRNSFDVRTIDARTTKRLYWLGVKLLTWASFLACRRAITVSHHARATFTAAFHSDADLRFDVVHHGVSESFSPPEDDSGRHPHRLLAVSDIYIQKNLETAIETVALLAPRYPDTTLDIAGRTLDPDYFEHLTRHCARLGVTDRVHFLGGVSPSRIGELLRQADVFLFPSLVETFGNPLLEAMASGLPVVCSDTSAMPEVAGDAALYADPGDAEQFALAVSSLFDDREEWTQQSAKGLARAQTFNWQKTSDRTAEVLIEVGRG